MQKNNRATSIPPRWLMCPRKGGVIAETFIPFKTPLDSRYDSQIPEECRFDVDMLFASFKAYRLKVGLIIDLTNTDRFYDKSVIEAHDCKYVKLACKGHGETPTMEYTQAFIDLCENFRRKDPLHVIGVHCTHGFNRSGFLIISYLVQKLGWSVDAAIATFSKLRPPGIYKQDYLDEIARRFPEIDVIPVAPALPDWCLECDDTDRDDDGNRISNSSNSKTGNGAGGGGGKKNRNKGSGVFMEGKISGNITAVAQPLLKQLQSKVQKMCGWAKNGFPGAQPVSMTCKNLEFLSQAPYKVSWKADGTRYMMLIDGEKRVYMVDRDNCIFCIPDLVFPRRKEPSQHIAETLLDGEMIFDEVKGQPIPRYLIYDIIKFESQDVGKTDFDRRLLCIDKEIIKPRNDMMSCGKLDRSTQPFSIRIKPFWDVTSESTKNLLEGKFAKEVSHETDGLIFQAANWRYTGGRCAEMLKWKPAEMNSVDFTLHIVREVKQGMLPETKGYLHVGGLDPPFAELKKVTKDMHQYNGKIIECKYDSATKKWEFMRQRVDKSFPNSFETAKGVCESIGRPVTKEILYEYIEKSRYRPGIKSPIMPPPKPGNPSAAVSSTHSSTYKRTSSSENGTPAKKQCV